MFYLNLSIAYRLVSSFLGGAPIIYFPSQPEGLKKKTKQTYVSFLLMFTVLRINYAVNHDSYVSV